MKIFHQSLLVLCLAALLGKSQATCPCTPVFINEFHYDNVGIDMGEFIEIAGPAGTDLTDWTIWLYSNGGGRSSYGTIPLSGNSIPDEGNGFGALKFTGPSLQNGSSNGDAFALVDPDDNVVQFLSYEGTFTAVGGPADGMTTTDVGVFEPNDTQVGDSLQLTGTGRCYEDFTWQDPSTESPAVINMGQTFTTCMEPPTCSLVSINEIHYNDIETDDNEFIEVFGPAGTDLAGMSLVLYNGAISKPYETICLSGVLLDQDSGFGTRTFTPSGSSGIQNDDSGSPDGVALVNAAGCVEQFISYGGTPLITAVDGPALGLTSIDIGVAELNDTPEGESLQVKGTCDETSDDPFEWEGPKDATPGCINKDQFKKSGKKDKSKDKGSKFRKLKRNGIRGVKSGGD